jgi:uncharacterized membrane protein YedE/YeeE
MTAFTPWSALLGGLLIGLAAVILLLLNGRIAGVIGIAAGSLWRPAAGDRLWRVSFLAGLVLGTAISPWFGAPQPVPRTGYPVPLLVLAGLAVGYGTALAGGCTSGHGVCGLGRLSFRSLVAVSVFLSVAIVTTTAARHLLGVPT